MELKHLPGGRRWCAQAQRRGRSHSHGSKGEYFHHFDGMGWMDGDVKSINATLIIKSEWFLASYAWIQLPDFLRVSPPLLLNLLQRTRCKEMSPHPAKPIIDAKAWNPRDRRCNIVWQCNGSYIRQCACDRTSRAPVFC
jgi:hypothetical protein